MNKFTKMTYKNINEELYIYNHKSGLKVYFIPKRGYIKKYATFSTQFGSINNNFLIKGDKEAIRVPDGVAHFLEHKLFEQKDGSVMDKFSALGADPNAYTSFSQTVYLFSCVDKFFENFKFLLEFVQNPYLTDESVEKEKGIIAQEIKMYEDNPHWRVFFNLLDGLYLNHPVKIDIAGTVDSIGKIDKEVLYKCYNTFYRPSNMAILVVGDLNFDQVIEYIDNNLNFDNNDSEIENIFPDEPNKINKKYIELDLEVAQPQFQIGFKEMNLPRIGKDSVIYEMVISILQDVIFGKSSNFYSQMYDKGLIDNSFQYDYTVEREYAFSSINGEAKYPEQIMENVQVAIKQAKSQGINKVDFARISKAYYGKLIKNLNSVDKISSMFNSVYYRDVNMFDYYELYDKITYELANDVLKLHFDVDRSVMSVIKPKY